MYTYILNNRRDYKPCAALDQQLCAAALKDMRLDTHGFPAHPLQSLCRIVQIPRIIDCF